MNKENLVYLVIGIVTIGLFFGVLFFASNFTSNNTNSGQNATQELSEEELITENAHATNNPEESTVKVVEFGDFQCPACKNAEGSVKQIQREFGEDVAVIYRHFPLTNIHQYAFDAAVASEAAANQDKFWEYHDELFNRQGDNQNPLEEEDFVSIAEDLELDVEKFEADLESDAVRERVLEDLNFARDIGINSTPTFFVNGKKVSTRGLVEEVRTALNQESGE